MQNHFLGLLHCLWLEFESLTVLSGQTAIQRHSCRSHQRRWPAAGLVWLWPQSSPDTPSWHQGRTGRSGHEEPCSGTPHLEQGETGHDRGIHHRLISWFCELQPCVWNMEIYVNCDLEPLKHEHGHAHRHINTLPFRRSDHVLTLFHLRRRTQQHSGSTTSVRDSHLHQTDSRLIVREKKCCPWIQCMTNSGNVYFTALTV